MGVEVIRPDIAGLMGAYGAALFGLRQCRKNGQTTSAMMSRGGAGTASTRRWSASSAACCGNHCQLTINTFADGRKFISGNRCDKPVTGKSEDNEPQPLRLQAAAVWQAISLCPASAAPSACPLCLNMYELLPFWHAFLTKLGFAVAHQPGVQPRPLSGRSGHHPQRHRLLPGQAQPRPHQGPDPDGIWTPSSTPA